MRVRIIWEPAAVAGKGERQTEHGSHSVGPRSVVVLSTNARHNLANGGIDRLLSHFSDKSWKVQSSLWSLEWGLNLRLR
jgi:hypothetical protein